VAKRKGISKPEAEQEASPRRLSRGTGPIFADIDGELRRRFHEISRLEKFPEKGAIEALVRYFVETLDGTERRAMLQGKKSAVQSLAKAIELLQWGQHSFTNKRWEWCTKVNLAIIEECKGITEVNRFANYRLGYCALSMAEGIMRELLEAIAGGDATGRELGHRAFEHAAKAGIYYSRKSIESGEMSVAHYNIACGLSLHAENVALEVTDWSSGEDWVRNLLKEIRKWIELLEKPESRLELRDPPSVNHPWWKVFGDGWRSHLQRSGREGSSAERTVDAALSAAIAELKRTVDLPTHAAVPGDAGELVRSSTTELDFSFLKCDSKYSGSFKAWRDSNQPASSRLRSFSTLWSHLKDAPAIEVHRLVGSADDLKGIPDEPDGQEP
jgi:hypothetical protein